MREPICNNDPGKAAGLLLKVAGAVRSLSPGLPVAAAYLAMNSSTLIKAATLDGLTDGQRLLIAGAHLGLATGAAVATHSLYGAVRDALRDPFTSKTDEGPTMRDY